VEGACRKKVGSNLAFGKAQPSSFVKQITEVIDGAARDHEITRTFTRWSHGGR
jgi:hypothetical protein